jgi:Raf kinase inhibitor-like YbhB/YbcL family protein
MIITSSAFDEGGFIPKKFSGQGGDFNPELLIQNVPPEAVSLALILHDPDAPTPGGFIHWIAWNINPTTAIIKEESTPPGALEGKNDAGKIGYVGPMPPSGTAHRYNFQLYALDTTLDLTEDATAKELQREIKDHTLARADLTGLYKLV